MARAYDNAWTHDEDVRLMSLAGRPLIEVADALGRSRSSCGNRIAKLRYLSTIQRGPQYQPDRTSDEVRERLEASHVEYLNICGGFPQGGWLDQFGKPWGKAA